MKDLIKKIGTVAILGLDMLEIEVKITNVRKAYGRVDFEVTPVAGSGSMWFSKARLTW